MPFLYFLAYVVLEIWVFIRVWDAIGFFNTMFALLIAAILGIGLVRSQGRYVIKQSQQWQTGGLPPTTRVMESVLIFLGGLLFILPGFISDAIALVFVLPGSRQLIAKWVTRKFAATLARPGQPGGAGFRVFTFGSGMGFRGSAPGRRPPDPSHSEPPQDGWARDVTPKVIDVTPISRTTRPKSDTGEDDHE